MWNDVSPNASPRSCPQRHLQQRTDGRTTSASVGVGRLVEQITPKAGSSRSNMHKKQPKKDSHIPQFRGGAEIKKRRRKAFGREEKEPPSVQQAPGLGRAVCGRVRAGKHPLKCLEIAPRHSLGSQTSSEVKTITVGNFPPVTPVFTVLRPLQSHPNGAVGAGHGLLTPVRSPWRESQESP